jgi:ABC-type nitrate/sulfonate/bicarbonate transport system substrate-binding protein
MSMNRRLFLRTLAVVGGTAALSVACAPLPGATPARTFKIGYLTLGWAGIEIIHRLGLLERMGWKIEWHAVDPISGLVNAFGSGQMDVIDMSTIIAGQMWEQGAALRVFGTAAGTLGAVVLGSGSSITSVPELRGRRVAGVPGSTTGQDLNASINKVHDFNVFTDTQFVQATSPADVGALLTKGDVEAALIWQPTTTQLVRSGVGRVLVTQQQLWEQASGSRVTQVHAVYVTSPGIANDFPRLMGDINAAQAEVAGLWTQRDPQAVEAMHQVTRLPSEVVADALGDTTPLSGLSQQAVDTMLQQLAFNRQYGTILQSDVWTQDTERAKRELFGSIEHSG